MPRPAKKDLEVYQGDDHSWPVTLLTRVDETTTEPYDLTGHTLAAHIRADVADIDATIDALFTFQIVDAAQGEFVMILDSEESVKLDAPRYKWDLQLTRTADDYITTLLYGTIVVSREITRI